jgi:hypothetical protein
MIQVQAFIWVPIILAVITIASVCFICFMDADRKKDTLLYAKFLTNVKDK